MVVICVFSHKLCMHNFFWQPVGTVDVQFFTLEISLTIGDQTKKMSIVKLCSVGCAAHVAYASLCHVIVVVCTFQEFAVCHCVVLSHVQVCVSMLAS